MSSDQGSSSIQSSTEPLILEAGCASRGQAARLRDLDVRHGRGDQGARPGLDPAWRAVERSDPESRNRSRFLVTCAVFAGCRLNTKPSDDVTCARWRLQQSLVCKLTHHVRGRPARS